MPEVFATPEEVVEETVILEEAAAIQQARELLKAAAERVWHIAFTQAWDGTGERGSAASLGRLAGCLEVAEDALFNVLNEASSRCHCATSHRAIRASFATDELIAESTPES